MNNINKYFIINLKHRTDRLKHILNECNKVNIDKNKIEIIEAVYEPELGALGCAKSHIIALEKFISSNDQTCIVFEDDFTFIKDKNYIDEKINYIWDKNWDVILLAGNIINIQKNNDSFSKVIEVWTTSGYLINKKYASILLNNFIESKTKLEEIQNNILEDNLIYDKKMIEYEREVQKLMYFKLHSKINSLKKPEKKDFNKEISEYNIDQNWKKLQKIDNWLIFYPTIGLQYANYSDISKIDVNYKC
jgi:GR25 family glycosyltransferase involved in LPS biosynthesis